MTPCPCTTSRARHSCLPITTVASSGSVPRRSSSCASDQPSTYSMVMRSEEHTSELQSQSNLVCRLLLEKKKNHHAPSISRSPPPASRPNPDNPSSAPRHDTNSCQ